MGGLIEIEFGKMGDLRGTSSKKICNFGDEWGRHGSPWADTLGKRSHGLQEGF